jgi:predicted Fe-S protein YdhL (DUF1289 family)
MVESPCIRHCNINRDNFCSGCGREIQEIQKWAKYSNEQKLSILELCKNRLKNKLDKYDE